MFVFIDKMDKKLKAFLFLNYSYNAQMWPALQKPSMHVRIFYTSSQNNCKVLIVQPIFDFFVPK